MIKKIAVVGIVTALFLGASFNFALAYGGTQSFSLAQLVELFIQLGIIGPDKAAAARSAVGSIASGGSVTTTPVATSTVVVMPPLYVTPYHDADTNHDWRISRDELSDFQKLYEYRAGTVRTGEYHVEQVSANVGNAVAASYVYVPGPGAHNGPTNSADTNKDWKISLTELTRVIELYNAPGGYTTQAGTEDGFAPVWSTVTSKPVFSLSGTPSITKQSLPTSSTGSASVVTANFNLTIQAVGDDYTFDSASLTPFKATVYKNGAPATGSSVSAFSISFSAPSAGAVTSGLAGGASFKVPQNNTVTVPIAVSFTPVVSGAYAVSLDSARWSNSAGKVENQRLHTDNDSSWRTASITADGSTGGTIGTLVLSDSSINLTAVEGDTGYQYKSITFTNSGSSPISYKIVVDNQPSWLNTGYAKDVLVSYPGSPTGIGASLDPRGLSVGTYTASIKLQGDFAGSPITIPVVATINPSSTRTTTNPTITPSLSLVASGSSVFFRFTMPANTVSSKLYISCPAGVSAKGYDSMRGITAGEYCNTYQDIGIHASGAEYIFTNSGSSAVQVVPNFYVYTSDNPNFARGVSTTVTVGAGGSTLQSIPVDLKVTSQSSAASHSAFITATVAGKSTNKTAASWKLSISCPSGVSMPGKAGQELCGTDITLRTADAYDITQDYTLLTASAVNSGQNSQNVILALVALDSSGNNIGGDKEFVIVPGTGSNASLPDLQVQSVSCNPESPKVNEWIYCTVSVYNASSVDVNTPVGVNIQGDAESISNIPAYSTRSVTAAHPFGFSTAGSHDVNFPIDIWSAVAESNESNNVLTKTIVVQNPTTASCTDSDGGVNINVAGTADGRVNGIGSYFTDQSVGANGGACSGTACTGVAEGYCENGPVKNYVYQCPSGYSVNGACATAPVSQTPTAPTLSTTSWYADDSSTWPTVSTPSSLSANQAIRVKGLDGSQYFNKTLGANSGKITTSPAAGTSQIILYIYDYGTNSYATPEQTVNVSVTNKPVATSDATGSIDPTSTTVNSGDTAWLTFRVAPNTVKSSVTFSCPSGVSVYNSTNTADGDLCNRSYSLFATDSTLRAQFVNTSGSVQNVIPNFYVYTSDRPDFAKGVSSQVTVNPAPVTMNAGGSNTASVYYNNDVLTKLINALR